ncbi:MAG TPA: sulfatase [Labilithrix sp.]|nr:sulfatase [Labilithrix sp.]
MRAVRFLLLGFTVGLFGCERNPSRQAPPVSVAADAALTVSSGTVDGKGDGGAPPVGSASAAAEAKPYNVLLITIDSLRADMPWAGYARPIAPRLSALHARSVSYKNAYSTSSFTSKSVAGLLTGRYPSELARTGRFFTKYLSAESFVCTHLGKRGIPCVGGHGHMYFGPGQSGFETGFEAWKLVPGITFDYQTDPYVTSDKLTPLAIEMLKDVSKDDSRPFFAWFHYMDPHDEYKPHRESAHLRPETGARRARDLYDEEVFFTDLWIGKLLDFVESQPWSNRTAIVVTADHGEAFGEHGVTRHAHEVWEELVHVPLFFYVPGATSRVVEATRGHVDLAPTFVELLGAKDMPTLPGTSLVPEITGQTPAVEAEDAIRDVIVDLPEDDYNERRRALIHGRTKLIAFGEDVRFALYDLDADPREDKDLVREKPELYAEMRRRYREACSKIKDVPPRGGIPRKSKNDKAKAN